MYYSIFHVLESLGFIKKHKEMMMMMMMMMIMMMMMMC